MPLQPPNRWYNLKYQRDVEEVPTVAADSLKARWMLASNQYIPKEIYITSEKK